MIGLRKSALFVFVTSLLASVAGVIAMLFYEFEVVRAWLHQYIWTHIGGDAAWLITAAGLIVAFPLVMMLQSRCFVGAGGTGIPQAIAGIKASISDAEGMVSLKIALGKIVLLFLMIISGATVGREGPSVHVAACLMMLASRMVSCPPELKNHGLIIAGGGAGIAAAFNTPIAGMIFAFEEIASVMNKESFGCVIRTVVIASLVGVAWLGNYLFYGRIDTSFSWTYVWVIPIIGVIGGLAGGLFAKAVVNGIRKMHHLIATHYIKWGLVAGGLLALCMFLSHGLTLGSGFQETQEMLLANKQLPWWYPFLKAGASLVSLVSMVPGGLFDPALAVGASLGQQLHGLFAMVDPGIPVRLPILLCMIAYFSGVVQSPITCCVIVLEMTGQYDLVLPCALTSVTAFAVSKFICKRPIYHQIASIIYAMP